MASKRPSGPLLIDLPLVLAGAAAVATAWVRGSMGVGSVEWLILSGAAAAFSVAAVRLAWRARFTSHRVVGLLRGRMAGPALVGLGILAVAVAGLADLLHFGTSPDFGRLQAPGVIAGCVTVLAGLALQVHPADLRESRAGLVLGPRASGATASVGVVLFAAAWFVGLAPIRIAGAATGIILTAGGLAASSLGLPRREG